jgi:hypothetical protein
MGRRLYNVAVLASVFALFHVTVCAIQRTLVLKPAFAKRESC